MKKLILIFIIFLLFIQIALAQENEETQEDSSLVSKIVSSLIEKIFDFFRKNAPAESRTRIKDFQKKNLYR